MKNPNKKKSVLYASNIFVLHHCDECGGYTGHKLNIEPEKMELKCQNCNVVNNSWEPVDGTERPYDWD